MQLKAACPAVAVIREADREDKASIERVRGQEDALPGVERTGMLMEWCERANDQYQPTIGGDD